MVETIKRALDRLMRRSTESAHMKPGWAGLELDISRGVVRQVQARPFAMRTESKRCVPSRALGEEHG